MAVKQAPSEEDKIGAVKAYDILQKRQISEDRILAERTSMFLLATAFLFLAFVTLLNPEWEGHIFKVLRIILPSVGIFLTLLLLIFNRSATKALGRWHDFARILEKKNEFKYMLDKRIVPHTKNPKGWVRKIFLSSRTVYWLHLPLAFFVLWTTSLVFVIVNPPIPPS